MVFSTLTYLINKSMGQITCTTQEVSPLTELSPQLLFWSVNLPILNTLELTSKYTTECSRIHGSQAHDNRCITGPTSNQRENCQTSLHNISPLLGSDFQPRLRNSITCHKKNLRTRQFNNGVSVATPISKRDLQQLQSQNNVQAGVLAKIGQQDLKKYKMVAKPSRHLSSIKRH